MTSGFAGEPDPGSRYDGRIVTRVGEVLAAKYRLEELLGSGGMGHVYRATNEAVGRQVAIKVLRSEHSTNAPIVERFLREARAANLVRHPNVVDVLDIGRDQDGSPFIVQELLRGQDLSKYVERRGGRLNLDEIEEYFLPVIDAVAEAHAHGVVHRDIKPENVFLADQGRAKIPKLLDFGISKIRLPDIRVTEIGVMMGTPAYMAPEQIQGSRDADPRSDVWALGVMLFELLSGRLPFEATDAPALFVAIATKDAPTLLEVAPHVEPDVSRVTERCLRRSPDDRYPTALELARDLRHVLEGTEIEPTKRFSAPPIKDPAFEVPDLALPAPKTPAKPPAGPKTLSGPPPGLLGAPPDLDRGRAEGIALSKTEYSTSGSPAAPGSPELSTSGGLELDTTPRTARSSPRIEAAVPDLGTSSAGRGTSNAPSSQPRSGGSRSGNPRPDSAASLQLEGVMLAPGTASTSGNPGRRPYPPATGYDLDRRRPPAQPNIEMAFLVGVSVVGLVAIFASAVLMTFAHQPGGFSILTLVTKPTPLTSLVVQGGLALAGFFLAGRFTVQGVKRWRGQVDGGRGSAIVSAIIGGAFFFAAIELARAAW
jgi:serine/threonine protein kinase